MSIITLTTDFGLKDYSVAAAKGIIYGVLPHAQIVDISHQILPFNTIEASYIIQNAYGNFPKGSIHIIDIDSEFSIENTHIAMQLNGHFFICANNGILSLLTHSTPPETIVEINIHNQMPTNCTAMQVFIKVACFIAEGGSLNVIGKPISAIKSMHSILPQVNSNNTQIIGTVIYIDNYGNVVTNIKRTFFENVQQGRTFEIQVRNNKFHKIYNTYNGFINFETPIENRNDLGRGLVLFNAEGYLEVAIYKSISDTIGGASTLMGLQLMDQINVSFIS